MAAALDGNAISAEPTKSFFVDMLIRDIALEQAVLDLLDNSVDGAKRLAAQTEKKFEDKSISINFNNERFEILDNCGGFGTDIAKNYAFRFGRPAGAERTPHSIGQFGVGMKRALFKFGRHFKVESATLDETWAVDVDVPSWEAEDGWTFPWADFSAEEISDENPGTKIVVTQLRNEVAAKFSSKNFENLLISLIKSKHRQFISDGLSVRVNGNHLNATNLFLLISDKIKPGVDTFEVSNAGKAPVRVKITAGVGASAPREAGWYIICNGRVVLEADRRNVTGWGVMEEAQNRILIPAFHNQFSRFRGVVTFDSDDSSLVPWNTTKDDIDQDSAIWQLTYEKMLEMMRPVITFLNDLDNDIEEHTKEHSPLLSLITKTPSAKTESIVRPSAFTAPTRDSFVTGPRFVKIQYSRQLDQVEVLRSELGVNSAKAVGEKTFDLMLARFTKK